MLSYADVEIISPSGTIIWDQTPVRYSVNAKLFIFTPVQGARVVGTIKNIGWDHIGLSVLGYFSASISQKQLRHGWSIDGLSILCPDGQTLAVGDKLCFEILDVGEYNSVKNSTFHLHGSLLRDDTGLALEELPEPKEKSKGEKRSKRSDGAEKKSKSSKEKHKSKESKRRKA